MKLLDIHNLRPISFTREKLVDIGFGPLLERIEKLLGRGGADFFVITMFLIGVLSFLHVAIIVLSTFTTWLSDFSYAVRFLIYASLFVASWVGLIFTGRWVLRRVDTAYNELKIAQNLAQEKMDERIAECIELLKKDTALQNDIKRDIKKAEDIVAEAQRLQQGFVD